jgi:hypothetical protein
MVLGYLREYPNYRGHGVIVDSTTLDYDGMDRVLNLLDWEIQPLEGQRIWVESPHDRLPHLHAVLGILRGSVPSYHSPAYDEALLKTLVKLDKLKVRSTGYNGIHQFVSSFVPALEFYEAFQEFVPELRPEGRLLPGGSYTTLVFVLTPEELNTLGNRFLLCQGCGKFDNQIVEGGKSLNNTVKHLTLDIFCGCGYPGSRPTNVTNMPIYNVDSNFHQSVYTKSVIALDLLVNEKGTII